MAPWRFQHGPKFDQAGDPTQHPDPFRVRRHIPPFSDDIGIRR
jgi:hypothetical protein